MSSASTVAASLALRGVAKTSRPERGVAGPHVAALAAVDLELAPGEIVAAVGTSGCGKSTLLQIAAGLEREHEGSVELAGSVTVSDPAVTEGCCSGASAPLAPPRHRAAAAVVTPTLLPWLTVADKVAFWDPAARNAAAGPCGRRDHRARRPGWLRGGLPAPAVRRDGPACRARPRPGTAPALAAARRAVRCARRADQDPAAGELLRIWAAERTTLLLVTHDIEEAVFLADRVVVMSGRPGAFTHLAAIELDRPRDRTSAARRAHWPQ